MYFIFLVFVFCDNIKDYGSQHQNYQIEKKIDHKWWDRDNPNTLKKYAWIGFSCLVFKLLPPPTWTYETRIGEKFYGFSNGLVVWYPHRLNFQKIDLKIGFFNLQHRSWEIVLYLLSFCMTKIETDVSKFLIFVFGPASFSFINIKMKFLRIDWCSLVDIIRFVVCYWKNQTGFFFSPWGYNISDVVNISLLYILSPRFSIDISWINGDINDDDEQNEDFL